MVAFLAAVVAVAAAVAARHDILQIMSRSNYTKPYERLLVGFMALIVIGLAALLMNNLGEQPSAVVFSLVAFTISAAALLLTTYQSFSAARQLRMIESMLRAIHDAGRDFEKLAAEDRKLERELKADLALDHKIIAVLEEYGVGDDEKTRRQVAEQLSSLSAGDDHKQKP